jgi:enoyl-CoA hydratase/carnithine racemase
MTYMYDMPDEIQVEADGPLRIITLNRPASLNAVNDALHTGLARLWPRLSEAVACARRIAALPRQAVEATKRILNLHLERAVLATIDYAMTAEESSFGTDDFRTTITQITEKLTEEKKS